MGSVSISQNFATMQLNTNVFANMLIIGSHGAASKFPSTVKIVVGPGFKDNFMPGYPSDPDAPLLDVDLE